MNLKTARIGFALTLLLSAAGAGTAAAQDPRETTLEELVTEAVAYHESVQLADSRLRRADADITLTSSALLPRLELNGSYTFYADEQVIELSPDESFVIRPSQDWSGSIDLRQTLFYGLRDWRARDIAKLNRDIAELDRATAINDLTLQVAAAFYDAVALEEWVRVRELVLEQNEKQLHVAERRYEVGEIPVADVARLRAQVAAAKQNLVVSRGEAELARNRLARLVGRHDLGRLRAPGPIPIPAGGEQELTDAALDRRLEMRTLVHQLEAAGLYVKVERGGWYPELEAVAQYFQQKAGFPANDWMSLSLQLRVPIYDGGLTKARVAKAREDLREVELLEQTLRRTIADQVNASQIAFESATAVLEAAAERTEAARLAYEQVESAYEAGEASATDLLAATAEATDAETAQIVARAQREYQAISLRYAVGLPPLPDLDSQLEPEETQE